MSIELHDKQLLKGRDLGEILKGTQPTAEECAVHDARRALDHAVMSIFELAMSLESLSDAIRRVRNGATPEEARIGSRREPGRVPDLINGPTECEQIIIAELPPIGRKVTHPRHGGFALEHE